ncbi:GGDEF domain-containing protein [Saccharobesus litoralis]|uniref:Sensor protein FixL n=1 Tax=Saccharobesus litoralis TaxID=2172099 RepID=A0A2S0VSY4_9ALTE|nr:EAL domain-containing protein [Saccharobesus litoralis]AWB67210.1 GGDEF domain-containing protein [Saccharobesus litoralis]
MNKIGYLTDLCRLQQRVCDQQEQLESTFQQALNKLNSDFALPCSSLWSTDNKEQTFHCRVSAADVENCLGSKINDQLIYENIMAMLNKGQPIFFSHLPREKRIAFEQMMTSDGRWTDLLIFPMSDAQCITGLLILGADTRFDDWSSFKFSLLCNQIFALANAYITHNNQKNQMDLLHQNELLNEIEQLASVGGWEYNLADQSMIWTDETYRIYGLEIGSPITADIGIQHYPNDAGLIIGQCFQQAIEQHIPYDEELRFIDAQGRKKWIRTTGKVRKHQGVVTHIYGAFEDITREKALISHEQDTSAYLATIINNLNDAVITVNDHGTILSANRSVEKIFLSKEVELVGKNVSVLMPQPYANMHQKYVTSYLNTGKAKIIGVGRELPAIRANGNEFPMELSLSEVIQNNQRVFIGIIKDISERKEAQDKIYQLAYFDGLTDLPNRISFERDLQDLLNKASLTQSQIYASLLDIDRFGQINLTYGKTTGNYALNMIAQRINALLPKTFKLYRNTADSFFLLHQTPLSDGIENELLTIAKLSQAILQSVSDEMAIAEHIHHLTISIGSAFTFANSLNCERFIQLLEFAKSQAKSKGGNTHSIIDNKQYAEFERRSLIASSLQLALNKNEFYLQLQPQYNTAGNIVASEALIRWRSTTFGSVSPAEFIPIAEDNGDIIQIGRWVLNSVCQLLNELNHQGIHTVIAVNLSAKQLIQPKFCQELLHQSQLWEISPQELMLEITETTLVTDIDLVKQRMLLLSKYGFRFSIDDFGTGYSSLSYLQALPIHELKIDRFFVEAINDNSAQVPIVNTILQMAKSLGVQTVAEGIENKWQQSYLAERGCDIYQGYLLSKPLDLKAWLYKIQQAQAVAMSE